MIPQRAPGLEIEGEEPGRDFILIMWDVHQGGPDPPIRPYDEIVKNDPVYRWCIKNKSMRGTFDEAGNARISLRPLLELRSDTKDLTGTRFRVGYLIHISKTDQRLSRWSDGVVAELR